MRFETVDADGPPAIGLHHTARPTTSMSGKRTADAPISIGECCCAAFITCNCTITVGRSRGTSEGRSCCIRRGARTRRPRHNTREIHRRFRACHLHRVHRRRRLRCRSFQRLNCLCALPSVTAGAWRTRRRGDSVRRRDGCVRLRQVACEECCVRGMLRVRKDVRGSRAS